MPRPQEGPARRFLDDVVFSVCYLGSRLALSRLVLSMAHVSFCRAALGARGDRGIRTPTSGWPRSTTQHAQQPKEDRLVRIPRQQPVDELPPGAHQLAGQTHERLDKRLELQTEHPTL